MKPEEKAREKIDQMLGAVGWVIQDINQMKLDASFGVAVKEFTL